METSSYITYALLALVVIFLIAPAIFSDRSPIPESSEKVHKITSAAELDALLKANTHVIADFFADWCPPCRAIAPVFSKLADEHAVKGKLAFAKVNVDYVKDVAGRYGVSAMPTFLIFKDGEPSGVALESIKSRASVGLTDDGLIDRVRGADRVALEAVVKALAGK